MTGIAPPSKLQCSQIAASGWCLNIHNFARWSVSATRSILLQNMETTKLLTDSFNSFCGSAYITFSICQNFFFSLSLKTEFKGLWDHDSFPYWKTLQKVLKLFQVLQMPLCKCGAVSQQITFSTCYLAQLCSHRSESAAIPVLCWPSQQVRFGTIATNRGGVK